MPTDSDDGAPPTRTPDSDADGGSRSLSTVLSVGVAGVLLGILVLAVLWLFLLSSVSGCACSPPPRFAADYDATNETLAIHHRDDAIHVDEDERLVVAVSGGSTVTWETSGEEADTLRVRAEPGDVVRLKHVGPNGSRLVRGYWLRPSLSFAYADGTATVTPGSVEREYGDVSTFYDGLPEGAVNATVYVNGERRATVDFSQSPRRVSVDADPGDTVRVAPFDTTWTVPGNETATTTPDAAGG